MVIFHCYVNVYQRVWNMYEPSMGIYGNRRWRSTDISFENYGNLNYGFSLCFHMGWIDGRLWNIWQEKHGGHLNFEIINLIDKHILWGKHQKNECYKHCDTTRVAANFHCKWSIFLGCPCLLLFFVGKNGFLTNYLFLFLMYFNYQ
jgi:hypothetical protein